MVQKYGEPYKVKSLKSGVLIQVGKGAYMNLKKEGYTDKQIILGTSKNMVMNPETEKEMVVGSQTYNKNNNVTNNIILVDDVIIEIYNQLSTIEKLAFCQVNKKYQDICKNDQHVMTLKFNQHPKLASDKSGHIYGIIDNKLYHLQRQHHLQTSDNKINIKLPPKIIPISVILVNNTVVVLTNDGLYQMAKSKFVKMKQPPGKILQIFSVDSVELDDILIVLTTTGIYKYKNDTYTLKIFIEGAYIMYPTSEMYYKVATPKGLYIVYDNNPIFVDIDKTNDILFYL